MLPPGIPRPIAIWAAQKTTRSAGAKLKRDFRNCHIYPRVRSRDLARGALPSADVGARNGARDGASAEWFPHFTTSRPHVALQGNGRYASPPATRIRLIPFILIYSNFRLFFSVSPRSVSGPPWPPCVYGRPIWPARDTATVRRRQDPDAFSDPPLSVALLCATRSPRSEYPNS